MKLCKKLFFVLALTLLVVLPASCIQQGAHVHIYGEWTLTTLPTETKPGKAQRVCTCGHHQKMAVASLSDTKVWTLTEEEPATCSKEGKLVYKSVYGEMTVEVATIEHEYTEYEITIDPTWEETGTADVKCKNCDVKEVDVPALSNEVWTLTEEESATCSKEGKEVYESKYGKVTVILEIVEHEYIEYEITTDPTLEETGKANATCKYGEVNVIDVPALSDEEWKVKESEAPTCTKEGKVVYKSIYGQVTLPLTKEDHKYGEWTLTTEPSMETTGTAERICESCGKVDEIVVPVLSDETVWTKNEEESEAPTCTEDGTDVYESEQYGKVTITTSAAHKYGEWTITLAPSMETTGTAERICESCHVEKEEVLLPVLSDETVWTKNEEESKAPTCTEEGQEVYTSEYGDVTVVLSKVAHTYGEWTLTFDPKWDEKGTAERTCESCGEVDEKTDVPELSDTTVWTKNEEESKAPTCSEKGQDVYESEEYGKVTVEIETVDHNYGEWTITLAPTKEETGKAERTCEYGETDEVELPVLSDTTVWTKTEVLPTEELEGQEVYTSEYGKVEIVTVMVMFVVEEGRTPIDSIKVDAGVSATLPNVTEKGYRFMGYFMDEAYNEKVAEGFAPTKNTKLYVKWEKAPIYNNDYVAIELTGNEVFGASTVNAITSAVLSIDEWGKATGNALPFNGNFEVTTYNKETGEIVIEGSGAYYKGFIDNETGIMIITNSSEKGASLNEVKLLTPFIEGVSEDQISSSYWSNGRARAIEYTSGETTYTILVYRNKVYFYVTFTNENNVKVEAKDAYDAEKLTVTNAEGKVVAKFGDNDVIVKELDGFEGAYTNTEAEEGQSGTLKLNGVKEAILNGEKGTYTLPTDSEADYMFDVYIQGVYYEVSVDDETMTYTIKKPMVKLIFNAEAIDSDITIETNKNIAIALPTLSNSKYDFKGWYKDKEHTIKVEGETYLPTTNETLYAKWEPKTNTTNESEVTEE